MKKSTKIRSLIFEILIEIYKKNKNFDQVFDFKINRNEFEEKDISFIFNVCLNTMRYSIHSRKILSSVVKKNLKNTQFVLLASAVTQIIYLNIKPYAVVNETVEVSKIKGLYPPFINAVLKKITSNLNNYKDVKILKKDFPIWFKDNLKNISDKDLSIFLENYFYEPSLHVVFKSKKFISKFKENYKISSEKSLFVNNKKKISDLSGYDKGYWWVQNFSSMLPVMLCNQIENKQVLDLCAAPGGKSFQILSQNKDIILNDKSKKRSLVLKENLKRLNFTAEVKNYDALEFPENNKFDVILLDAPCSATGTIRSNPEIIFRKKEPDLKSLFKLQEKLLMKSSNLVNNNGIIIYMVCSFLYSETIKPINKFLEKNKNFSILKYDINRTNDSIKSFLSKDGFFLTVPREYMGYKIDGFFSIQLINNA